MLSCIHNSNKAGPRRHSPFSRSPTFWWCSSLGSQWLSVPADVDAVLLDAFRDEVAVPVPPSLSSSWLRTPRLAHMWIEAVVASKPVVLFRASDDAGDSGDLRADTRVAKASAVWSCFSENLSPFFLGVCIFLSSASTAGRSST